MKLGQKVIYFLSLAALPLGPYGCKKDVFPPQEPDIDPTELTTDTTGQIEPYDMVIQWSWDSCRIGPHWDLVNYYLFDDACMSLHLVPDSTDKLSVLRSTGEIPGLWERVVDTLETINQRSQGKLKFDGGVIHVKRIVPDSLQSSTMTPGIYPRTAERFRRLGITVKPEEGKPVKPSNSRKPISWQKLTPKVVRAKNAQKNGHYTKRVVFGWNDYQYGPTEMHFMAYIRDLKCDSVIFVPDSSVYSTINAVGGHSCSGWAKIANTFCEYKQRAPHKVKFAGKIYYNYMDPETKEQFESLGFKTVEYPELPGLCGAENTIPIGQAQQMLWNKQR